MPKTIIQWNFNGYYARITDLKRLINDYMPEVICLQETHFKGFHSATPKGYSVIHENRIDTNHASGGVAIFIRENINFYEINLNNNIEAVAAVCYLPTKTCICNVYLPNWYKFDVQELESLISQLPTPFILLGDFNAHNTI